MQCSLELIFPKSRGPSVSSERQLQFLQPATLQKNNNRSVIAGVNSRLQVWVVTHLLEQGEPSGTLMKSLEELTFLNWACSQEYRRIMGRVKSKVILRPSTISLHRSSLRRQNISHVALGPPRGDGAHWRHLPAKTYNYT